MFFSCKKNSDTIDTSPHFYFLNGDTTGAVNNVVLFGSSDTMTVNLVISSTYLVPSDVKVTIAPADQFRTTYNSVYSTNYQAMPANAYTLQTTSIFDSTVFETITISFYKNQIPANQQFMLPVQITDASGKAINDGTSVIYLSTSNNILSGRYTSFISRVNYNGDSSGNDVSSTDTLSISKSLVPDNSTVSEIDYADLGSNGWKYVISNIDDNFNFKFSVTANNVILNSVQQNSFKILGSSFDSATKKIYIKSTYKNTTGNQRVVEETLNLQ